MEQQLFLRKIYLKNISYEAFDTPQKLFSGITINPNLDLNFSYSKVGENIYELVMESNIIGKDNNNEDVYKIKVINGGIFEINGTEEEIETCLNVNCTSILFPYLRQEVDNIVHYSGYPPFYIQPISFYEIYQNKKAKN
jgi:preprotein translocase subunit SecB